MRILTTPPPPEQPTPWQRFRAWLRERFRLEGDLHPLADYRDPTERVDACPHVHPLIGNAITKATGEQPENEVHAYNLIDGLRLEIAELNEAHAPLDVAGVPRECPVLKRTLSLAERVDDLRLTLEEEKQERANAVGHASDLALRVLELEGEPSEPSEDCI